MTKYLSQNSSERVPRPGNSVAETNSGIGLNNLCRKNPCRFATLALLPAILAGIPSITFAALSSDIVLQVVDGQDRPFGLVSSLDTLTPQLGTLTDTGNVTISGNLTAVLDLSFTRGFANPAIHGLQLVASELIQSGVGFRYPLEVGPVEFDTTDLATHLSATSAVLPVSDGEFSAAAVRLLQNAGEATVRVPQKPSAFQYLVDAPVTSQFAGGPESGMSPMGRIDLVLLSLDSGIATYRVELEIPLAGQEVAFNGVGLPVDLYYAQGTLVATGTFQQVIPEPSTLVLVALLAVSITARAPFRTRYQASHGRESGW